MQTLPLPVNEFHKGVLLFAQGEVLDLSLRNAEDIGKRKRNCWGRAVRAWKLSRTFEDGR
jgi:hypothetical protein